MYYYEDAYFDNQGTLMSMEEFVELFGADYECEWVEGGHCCIDPFYEEIRSLSIPLVAHSLEELREAYWNACQEI